MAISLSDLTGASTSGNVLNEVNSYADFLDSVPRLVNKADPSGATDAVQTVATKQPIALPLIDGEGYLFCSGVDGNGAVAESPILPSTGDFDLTIDFIWKNTGVTNQDLFAQYDVSVTGRFFIYITTAGELKSFWDGGSSHQGGAAGSIIEGRRHVARFNRTGNTFTVYLDGASYYSYTVGSSVPILAVDSTIGNGGASRPSQTFKGAIFSVTEGSSFECDFTSPRIPHGATEFTCETGQVVTVNASGNNPAKVIKKPVLRFDGDNDGLNGFFNQTFTGGYMFAAFSVLGDGGETSCRIFTGNSTGAFDYQTGGFALRRYNLTDQIQVRWNGGSEVTHGDVFNGERGDFLLESPLRAGDQNSLINNADADDGACVLPNPVSSEEFNICTNSQGDVNACLDLEYLALFPATLTDSQADQIRNFINNRNKVFYRWDTDGYYFFDGAATDDGQVFTGSGSWNGRIVGSDNGDSDFYISQNTLDDRPTTDGYKITFADNTDHFDIPSTTQAGWQIVGTSLGTFAYKVDSDAITELNLLGNAAVGDGLNYRRAGDLYGIILLPESATNRDIEEARKLLIDRGAADGVTTASLFATWYARRDIVEFKHLDTSNVTDAQSAWLVNNALQSFPALDLSNATTCFNAWNGCSNLTDFPSGILLGNEAPNVDFTQAWANCTNLQSFPALDLSTGNNFTSAWNGCSSLTQFPQDAKLGTEAANVSFQSAWQSSGLTSFPADIDLSKGINFANTWRQSGLTSFPAIQSTLNGRDFFAAWYFCQNLTSFGAANINASRYFSSSWQSCANLEDFPALFSDWNPSSIANAVFNNTWSGCTSLTAQSVENILTSIDASGKHATTTGASGGPALGDATIDIDYNGDPLTAATLSAIETLNGRGWSVNINGVIQ